jgi:hypothetical protein
VKGVLRPGLHRPLVTALVLVGSLAGRAAPARPPVEPRHRVAGRGHDVRIRTPYRPGLRPLTRGPLIALDPSTTWSNGLVGEANYQAIKTYAIEVLRRYPPDRFYYVGIGRSPTTVIAMLKNLGPDLAMSFPASGLNDHARARADAHRSRYQAHIEGLIPRSVRHGDRKLLLLDLSSGPSLRGLEAVFADYRAAGGVLPDVELVSLGTWGARRESGVPLIDLGTDYAEARDLVAEYRGEQNDGGHIIHSAGGTLDALRRNPMHGEHRRALFQRMRRDLALDRVLRAEFPTLLRSR